MKSLPREVLTLAEAAVVANVSVRDVNRTIDERILPEDWYSGNERMRRFEAPACTLIAFYFHAAHYLTSEERLHVISMASGQLRKNFRNTQVTQWIVRDNFLSIDLGPFLKKVRERLTRLAQARASVREDPEILKGTPVIKGTRIPIYDIAASVEAGQSVDRIMAAYPGLGSSRQIELAALYARANPQRGRPLRSLRPSTGSVVVSRHVTRRRQAS